MHAIRRGSGKPLLLIHGLGSSLRNWDPVLPALSAERKVIAVDLPGFGRTPPL
ncbi:MAG: alpha/beta fold hydrolase, partial [Trebonia sp.]